MGSNFGKKIGFIILLIVFGLTPFIIANGASMADPELARIASQKSIFAGVVKSLHGMVRSFNEVFLLFPKSNYLLGLGTALLVVFFSIPEGWFREKVRKQIKIFDVMSQNNFQSLINELDKEGRSAAYAFLTAAIMGATAYSSFRIPFEPAWIIVFSFLYAIIGFFFYLHLCFQFLKRNSPLVVKYIPKKFPFIVQVIVSAIFFILFGMSIALFKPFYTAMAFPPLYFGGLVLITAMSSNAWYSYMATQVIVARSPDQADGDVAAAGDDSDIPVDNSD